MAPNRKMRIKWTKLTSDYLKEVRFYFKNHRQCEHGWDKRHNVHSTDKYDRGINRFIVPLESKQTFPNCQTSLNSNVVVYLLCNLKLATDKLFRFNVHYEGHFGTFWHI